MISSSTDDKEIVDQAILRAEESEPDIFDPSKFNLVEEVSTKVKLYFQFFLFYQFGCVQTHVTVLRTNGMILYL